MSDDSHVYYCKVRHKQLLMKNEYVGRPALASNVPIPGSELERAVGDGTGSEGPAGRHIHFSYAAVCEVLPYSK